MKNLFVGLIALFLVCTAPLVQAQVQNLRIGDGGTQIDLIQTGRVTLSSGVGVVTTPSATATANIWVQAQVANGTTGVTYSVTRTAGTSFTITAKAADGTTTATGDTSQIAYFLVQPHT